MKHKFHESTPMDQEIRGNSCRARTSFWRNVTLIALAHVALIAGLIHWSLAARASSNPQSIVWLGAAEDLAAGESENESPPRKRTTAPAQFSENEEAKEEPVTTAAKSEIELASPTLKPTPMATSTPKPTATPTPKQKTTPKPIPKPTPNKALVAKASPKPSPKEKASPTKASEKIEKTTLAKTGSASQSGSGKTGSPAKGGATGGPSAAEFGWYGNMLHDRFYTAWVQPTTNIVGGEKISTLVKVRIEKDGRVSSFEIIKPSENVVVNESVGAVAKQVTQVDPPPTGLIKGDHYDVKINFELSIGEQ